MATKAELKARLSLDTALFERGIHAAHAGTQRLGSAMTSVGSIGVAAWAKLAGAVAAVGGAAGFVKAVHGAFELGSSLKEMSDRTGIAVGKLVVLQEAFREAGLEADDIGMAINKMQKFIEQAGPKKLGDAFFILRQMRPEDQFKLLAQVISQMPSASERAAAAIEAFGRGGGKLLQVFAKSGEWADIQQSLGKQADLLNQNAAKFDQVVDHLKRIGTQFRGFFVGVAAGIVDTIKPIIDKMSKVDFTEMGQKFGKALLTGAEAVAGFFQRPDWLFYGVTEALKAALMEGGNVLIAVFKAAVEFFHTGLVSMFVGLGDTIIGVLMQAFAKPIAYLQAGIEYAMALVGSTSEKQAAKEEVATLTQMLAVIDKARDQAWAKSQAAIGSISDEERQKARDRFTELQASHEKLMQQRADAERRAAGNIPSIAERAQRIMQEGGPGFGIFDIKTAQQYLDEGAKKLAEAFDAASAAVKHLKVEDVLGAKEALAHAMTAFQVAAQVGQKVFQQIPGMLGQRRMAGPGESQELVDQIEQNRIRFEEQLKGVPLSERHFRTPMEEWQVNQDQVMADFLAGNEASMARMQLSLKQRFEEFPVFTLPPMMRDPYIAGAIMGAHGVEGARGLGGPVSIISDRHARREAWLRDKAERGAKDSLVRTNTFLDQIQRNTLETAQAWQ